MKKSKPTLSCYRQHKRKEEAIETTAIIVIFISSSCCSRQFFLEYLNVFLKHPELRQEEVLRRIAK